MLGALPWRSSTVLGWFRDLHVTLFAGVCGMVLVGLLGVLLMVSGLTGFWLYRGFWKNFFTLRWGGSARIFFSDLHKMVGITSVLFSLVVGFTGAWWDLQALPQLWRGAPQEQPGNSLPIGYNVSLDALVVEAGHRLPGFKLSAISPPSRSAYNNDTPTIQLTGNLPASIPLSDASGTVRFDPQTGAVLAVEDTRKGPLWNQIETTFAPLHFGTFGGLPIKILWALGGLTPGILAVSGFFIWRSRRRSGRQPARMPSPAGQAA